MCADDRDQVERFTGAPYRQESMAYWAYGLAGPKWCGAREDGQAVAAGGFVPVRPGVFQTWFVATDEAWGEYTVEVTRICALVLENMLAQGAHRIETYVLASRRAARLWYTRIGLKREAALPGYGSKGETALLYTAVRLPDLGAA
jgi:hypothetical protein